MTDAETIIARVLGEHARAGTRYVREKCAEADVCRCGSLHPQDDGGRWPTHRAHVAAEVARALRDAALLPEATTRVEWRIDGPEGPSYAIGQDHPEAEHWTRRVAAMSEDRYPVRRTVTTYADHVTEWEPAE